MRKLLFAFIVLMVVSAAYAADIGDMSSMLKDPPKPTPAYVPKEVVVESAPLPAQMPLPKPAAPAVQQPQTITIPARQPSPAPATAPVRKTAAEEDIFGNKLIKFAKPPKLSIEDHDWKQKPAKINRVTDPKTKKKTNLTTQGNYTVYLNLTATKRLLLENATITSNTTIRFEEVPNPQYENSVAIDLSGISFGKATYTAVAKKFELYKCKQWNFTTQDCDGSWVKIRNIAPGTAYTVELGPDDPSLAEGGGIFYDGFENGFEYNNWTINGTGGVWVIASHDPYNGTYHAGITQSGKDKPSSMIVNVSTVGYSSIGVHFMRRLVGIDTADQYIVRWYNGTHWKVLEQVTGSAMGDPYYVSRDHILDKSANNNPNFALELMCMMDANVEHCHIDELRITNNEPVPAAEMGCGLFFDGFESGFATKNWTINGTGVKWAVATTNPYNGTRHANAQKTGKSLPTSMRANISTANFTSIRVRYARRRIGIDAADEFAVLWNNGTQWNVLEETASGAANDANYVVKDFILNGSAANRTMRLEFMCMADATGEACRVDDVCINGSFLGDNKPPTVWWTNVSSTYPEAGDSLCFLANVTDNSGVRSVSARIRLPNGTNITLPLYDDLTCNSPEGDNVYSNHIIVPLTGTYNWTIVNVTDNLGNSANVPVSRILAATYPSYAYFGLIPPNLSRYNNGTIVPLALINTSNNVYATQNLPAGAATFMYFNWTLNYTDSVVNSNVTIEHSYSATSQLAATLQIKNGTNWQYLCTLSVSRSDTIETCDLDRFVDSSINVINSLQLRLNASNSGTAKTGNVDHAYIRFETLPAGTITACRVTINKTTTLSRNLTASFGSTAACISFGNNSITLDCAGYAIASTNNIGYGINATLKKNITIKNCISKSFSRGINFLNINDSTIQNNTLLDNDEYGIYAVQTNYSSFRLNNISRNYDNMMLLRSVGNNVTNNTFGNAFGDTKSDGLLIYNSTRQTLVMNNSFIANRNDSVYIIFGSHSNTIRGNRIEKTGENGIYISRSGGNTLDYNIISNSSNDGIYSVDSNFTIISQNSITNSFDNAITIVRGLLNNISENTITNASGSGTSYCILLYDESSSSLIVNNSAQRCKTNGLHITLQSNNNTALNNTFERNLQNGIAVSGSIGNNITLNVIRHNGDDGIALTGSNGTIIANNTVVNNTDDGIGVYDGSNNNIIRANYVANNTASATESDGIDISSNAEYQYNNTAEMNVVYNIGDDGIQALNLSFNTNIINNTITLTGTRDPYGEGIQALWTQNANISLNTINTTGMRGIYVRDTLNAWLSRNTISNTGDEFIQIIDANNTLVENNTITPNGRIELSLQTANDTTILDSLFNNYTFVSSGLTFRDTGEGEIAYLRKGLSRTGINLSRDVIIGNNSIHVNDTRAPQLNESANVTIFGINESDAGIEIDYRDDGTFADCPSTICTQLENNQTLELVRFNVTGFSTYRAVSGFRVRAIALSPSNGDAFLINGTVNITANATGTRLIDSVYANITKPDGSTILLQLTNQTRDIYNATLRGQSILLRGRYNITFIANDTKGKTNASTKVFFARRANNIIDITDVNDKPIDFSISVLANNSGVLDLNVTLDSTEWENGERRLIVSDHSESSPHGVFSQGYNTNESTFYSGTDYAWDFSLLNFSLINVTMKALAGNMLYKSPHFNMTDQEAMDMCERFDPYNDNCTLQPDGLWDPVAEVSEDSTYSFLITNATDPGFAEYNTSQRENEANTTSTTPVTALVGNYTPDAPWQHVVIGYAEMQATSNAYKVYSQLLLNDTSEIGNFSRRIKNGRVSDPPGDYLPFYTHQLIDLNAAPQNFTINFWTQNAASAAYIRRARTIAMVVNNSDAVSNDTGDNFIAIEPISPARIAVANASYTPAQTQSLLVLASAELAPFSTTNSLAARLMLNNTEISLSLVEGLAVTDTFVFAAHTIIQNAPANVQQNISITGEAELTTGMKMRRARITIVPLAQYYYNASENSTYTTSLNYVNKTVLKFNLTEPADVIIMGTAEVRLPTTTSGRSMSTTLFLDNQPVGNMTSGSNDFSDLWSFVAVNTYNLSNGTHTANIALKRQAGGGTVFLNISRARITVVPTSVIRRADLEINSSHIVFNNTNPDEYENITINATVFNVGTAAAPNVLVQFWDGPYSTGTLIGNATISPVLLGGQNKTVNVTYISVIGNRTITVIADPLNQIPENNKTNNRANKTLNVKAHSFIYGKITGNLTLSDANYTDSFQWNHTDAGLIYLFTNSTQFNFSTLQAIGRNTTNGTSPNDFISMNTNLNMTRFNDSMQFIWAVNTTIPQGTRDFTVFNRLIENVPVINSTNTSSFVTGILWDTEHDTNGHYDTVDKEPIVFVANINLSQKGQFADNIDYEARIPTLLRSYLANQSQIVYIVELD
jgi:parallel beta-helix repeat protein